MLNNILKKLRGMTMTGLKTEQLSADFSCTTQISVADIAQIAAQGFKTIVNNRPDGEGGAGQPTSAQLQAEAEKHGIVYIHIPVVPGGITAEHVALLRQCLETAPKPVLGFCKSGRRASSLYQMASGR